MEIGTDSKFIFIMHAKSLKDKHEWNLAYLEYCRANCHTLIQRIISLTAKPVGSEPLFFLFISQT